MLKSRNMIIALCLLMFTSLLVGCAEEEPVVQTERVTSVEALEAEIGDVYSTTTLTAKVAPNETATVVPKMPGKVVGVYAELGQRVERGQQLFRLDDRDIINQVKQAEAAYNTTKANAESSREQFDIALKNLETSKALYEAGAISKQQLEQAELQASNNNLKLLEAQEEQSRLAVEIAQSTLADTIVTAPISGYITSLDVKSGEMVSNAAPVVTLANIDKVIIETTVSEFLINSISIGEQVKINVPSASISEVEGRITGFSPNPAPNSLTYPVKIEIPNPNGVIKGGMFAEVMIITEKRAQVLTIPSQSVVIKDGKTNVFVVEEEKAYIREVEVGLDDGVTVEIKDGIEEGELIVTSGQSFLDDGQIINVVNGGHN